MKVLAPDGPIPDNRANSAAAGPLNREKTDAFAELPNQVVSICQLGSTCLTGILGPDQASSAAIGRWHWSTTAISSECHPMLLSSWLQMDTNVGSRRGHWIC